MSGLARNNELPAITASPRGREIWVAKDPSPSPLNSTTVRRSGTYTHALSFHSTRDRDAPFDTWQISCPMSEEPSVDGTGNGSVTTQHVKRADTLTALRS